MAIVNIAEFRRRIAEYLRRVRNGEQLTIADRNTPIARLQPVGERPDDFVFTPPPKGYGGIKKIRPIGRPKDAPPLHSLYALGDERADR